MDGYSVVDALDMTPGGRHVKTGFENLTIGRFEIQELGEPVKISLERKTEPMKVQLPGAAFTPEKPPSSPMFAGDRSPFTAPKPKVMLPGKMLRFQEESKNADDTDAQDHPGEQTPGSVINRNGSRVYFPPGLNPPPNTPSHGSTLHADGSCKPCAWFFKASGCQNGKDCLHCHLCPSEELKVRKKSKSAFLRLGLVTPEPDAAERAAALLAMSMVSMKLEEEQFKAPEDVESGTDQGSTAAPNSEDTGSPTGALPAPSALLLPPELLQPSPSSPGGPTPSPASRGSAQHGTGECRPCAWHWKPSGCLNGAECEHCHACPSGEVKARKKAKQLALRMGLDTPRNDGPSEEPGFAIAFGSP